MKNFEDLLKDLEEGEEEKEEIEDKEIEARIQVFMRTVSSMDKKQKKQIKNLSLKLNSLCKLGCNAKQLMKAFNLEVEKVIRQ